MIGTRCHFGPGQHGLVQNRSGAIHGRMGERDLVEFLCRGQQFGIAFGAAFGQGGSHSETSRLPGRGILDRLQVHTRVAAADQFSQRVVRVRHSRRGGAGLSGSTGRHCQGDEIHRIVARRGRPRPALVECPHESDKVIPHHSVVAVVVFGQVRTSGCESIDCRSIVGLHRVGAGVMLDDLLGPPSDRLVGQQRISPYPVGECIDASLPRRSWIGIVSDIRGLIHGRQYYCAELGRAPPNVSAKQPRM